MREVQNKFSSQNLIVILHDHDFSSKLCFEEKSLSSNMIMNFFVVKPCLKLPHVPAGIIRHSEDQINEALDLMRLKTLK